MRKPRNAEDTRQRVLAAARELFAEKGFAGTSLALIAQKSGISDGLILHHYQSKEALYRQVLADLAGSYARALAQAPAAAASPTEAMQQTLRGAFRFWKEDRVYQRISLWAYLEGRTELTEQETGLTAALVRQVEALQAQGLIDTRFQPMIFLTLVIGPVHFWLRYRDEFKTALNLSAPEDELDELFLGQLIRLVQEISAKPGSDHEVK